MYGHAGDGNVHLHPMGQEKEEEGAKAKELLVEIFKVGVSLGGTISGEHGLGFAKSAYLPLAMSEPTVGLMRRIKQAFDPNNIMNPGKVFTTEQP